MCFEVDRRANKIEIRKAVEKQGAMPAGLEFIAVDSDKIALSNLDSVPESQRIHLAAPDDRVALACDAGAGEHGEHPVRQAGLLHEILPVVDVHGLGFDRHAVVRALLGLVVVAVGDLEELLDVARLELVDRVGGVDELAFPGVLGHDLPVVVEAERHVRAAARRQRADDLVAEVFLDGEGDVEVDVLRLAEVLGDLRAHALGVAEMERSGDIRRGRGDLADASANVV